MKLCYYKAPKWKYRLAHHYDVNTPILPPKEIRTDWIVLHPSGRLYLAKGYACDGPSGPTIDTPSFMRGAFAHDGLFQLMRLGLLEYPRFFDPVNRFLQQCCIEDGMYRWRAWYVYKFVSMFGHKHARPADEKERKVICVP